MRAALVRDIGERNLGVMYGRGEQAYSTEHRSRVLTVEMTWDAATDDTKYGVFENANLARIVAAES